MSKGDNDDLPELLRSLGFYQAQITAELAKAKRQNAGVGSGHFSRPAWTNRPIAR